MHGVGVAQAILVSAVFLVAGSSKLQAGSAQLAGVATMLKRFLPTSVVPTGWGTLGALELALAGAALVPASSRFGLAASAGLLAIFVSYQVWIARAAPGTPCGCFGARTREVTSGATILRTGLLSVAAATGAVIGGTSGANPLSLMIGMAFAIAEGVALALLTMRPQAALASIRRGQEQDCATVRVPLDVTLAVLRRSDAWRRWRSHLSDAGEIRDQWRSGCWRFVSFNADYHGRAAVAVFAARVGDRRSDVRVALVDRESDVVSLPREAKHCSELRLQPYRRETCFFDGSGVDRAQG